MKNTINKFILVAIAVLAFVLEGNAQSGCTPQTKQVTGGGSICSGQTSQVSLSSAELDVFYQLKLNGTNVSTERHDNNGGTITWSVAAAGTYTVVAHVDGCSQFYPMSGDAIVTITAPTTITITASGEACEAAGYTLTASGGSSYTWQSNVTLDQTRIHNTSFSVEQSGDYWVTGVNNCGTSMQSNTINVSLKPRVWTPSVPSGTTVRCKGSGTDTYTSAASNATSYSWAVTGSGNSVSSGGVVTWDANFAGTARVTVTAYGCGGSSASSYVDVQVGTINTATVSGGATVCAGVAANITLTGSLDPNVLYTLRLNGVALPGPKYGGDSNGNPVSSLSWSQTSVGTYTVTASGYGCTNVPMTGSASISNITPTTLTITGSGETCEGGGYTLTASGGSSYTWQSNVTLDQTRIHNTSFSVEQSGDYWVTGVNNCGTSMQSNVINVSLTPRVWTPSVPSGTTVRCKGSGTDTYTSAASYATSYSWAVTGSGNSVSSGGVVTWDANFAGTARVTVTAYGCGGSSAGSYVDVQVGEIPVATVDGGATVCLGTSADVTLTGYPLDPDVLYTLRLNGVDQPGPKYGGDAAGNPVNTLTWSKSGFGNYTVTASGKGCTNVLMAGSAAIVQKMPSSITLSPSMPLSSVCEGDELLITASGSSTYEWFLQSPPGSNEPNTRMHPEVANILTPVEPGTYYVNGVDTNCGTDIRADMDIFFKRLPNNIISPVGSLKICASCAQTINTSTGSGYVYQWFKDGNLISGATNSSYTANLPGAYTVSVTSNGCNTVSDKLEIEMNALPVISVLTEQILFEPATATTISAAALDPDGSIQSYEWSKVSGGAVTLNGQTTNTVAISQLALGNYVFRIKATDNLGDVAQQDVSVDVLPADENYNFVRDETILVEGKTTLQQIQSLPVEAKSVVTNYIDGLGRSMQTVNMQGSPGRQDVVHPVVYDAFGREHLNYLPVVMQANGRYKPNEQIIDEVTKDYKGAASDFYNNTSNKIADDGNKPFAQTIFEPSPLNRVSKQGAPGSAWQPDQDPENLDDRSVKKRYEINEDSEVLHFIYDGTTGKINISREQSLKYYPAGQLHANKTLDEHNNEVVEFSDNQGRVVCKKVQYATENGVRKFAATYYLYDDFGNLVVVLPPEASKAFAPQSAQ